MKKTETPKTDASAKPDETAADAKTTATGPSIAVDSKGNASMAANSSDTAKSAPASSASASASSPASNSKAADKPGDKAPHATANARTTAAAKKSGSGTGIAILILILAVIIAAGWFTRPIWWQRAEPTIRQFVPANLLAKIAPAQNDTFMSANENRDTDTAPAMTGTSQSGQQDSTPANTDSGTMGDAENPAAPDTGIAATTTPANGVDDNPVVVDPALTERLSRLEGTIDALRERLDAQRGGNLNDSVARRMAEIETRSAPIEELARVESELAGVASEMRELSARLSTMEEEVRATAGLRVESRGQAIAMAVSILRDALQRGGPFVVALNQLGRAAADDDVVTGQIELLKPLADNGAMTFEKLRQTFPEMAQDAIRSANDDNSGSVLDATWANLKKLVPIRRIDVVGEDSLDGRLAAAENALQNDDLDGVIAALDGVSGENARAAVADWLTQAKNRQTIDHAINTLGDHAITLLTGNTENAQ